MQQPARPHVAIAALMLVAILAACTDAAQPMDQESVPVRSAAPITELNPQPEPPSLALRYELGPDGTDWFGTVYVGDEACGTMQLVQTATRSTGVARHVVYSLTIVGANPAFLMDATLSGIVVRDHVVLNGRVHDGAYAGRTIHPRGEIQTTITDGEAFTRMTGLVQLNPQPEPPSSDYPPSPCSQ